MWVVLELRDVEQILEKSEGEQKPVTKKRQRRDVSVVEYSAFTPDLFVASFFLGSGLDLLGAFFFCDLLSALHFHYSFTHAFFHTFAIATSTAFYRSLPFDRDLCHLFLPFC